MRISVKQQSFFVVLLAFLAGSLFVTPAFAVEKMPTFELAAAQGGKKIKSADYRGKVLVINFWATWCPPCRKEIPTFREMQTKYGAKGFSVIGIAMDEGGSRYKSVRKMIQKAKINYPIGMASSKVVRGFGGVNGIPVTIFVDRQGNISKRYDGYVAKSVIIKEIEKVLH